MHKHAVLGVDVGVVFAGLEYRHIGVRFAFFRGVDHFVVIPVGFAEVGDIVERKSESYGIGYIDVKRYRAEELELLNEREVYAKIFAQIAVYGSNHAEYLGQRFVVEIKGYYPIVGNGVAVRVAFDFAVCVYAVVASSRQYEVVEDYLDYCHDVYGRAFFGAVALFVTCGRRHILNCRRSIVRVEIRSCRFEYASEHTVYAETAEFEFGDYGSRIRLHIVEVEIQVGAVYKRADERRIVKRYRQFELSFLSVEEVESDFYVKTECVTSGVREIYCHIAESAEVQIECFAQNRVEGYLAVGVVFDVHCSSESYVAETAFGISVFTSAFVKSESAEVDTQRLVACIHHYGGKTDIDAVFFNLFARSHIGRRVARVFFTRLLDVAGGSDLDADTLHNVILNHGFDSVVVRLGKGFEFRARGKIRVHLGPIFVAEIFKSEAEELSEYGVEVESDKVPDRSERYREYAGNGNTATRKHIEQVVEFNRSAYVLVEIFAGYGVVIVNCRIRVCFARRVNKGRDKGKQARIAT